MANYVFEVRCGQGLLIGVQNGDTSPLDAWQVVTNLARFLRTDPAEKLREPINETVVSIGVLEAVRPKQRNNSEHLLEAV